DVDEIQMKFFLPLIFSFVILQSSPLRHEVIFVGGGSAGGRVAAMEEDSLLFQPQGKATSVTIPLDSVLYVHNGKGKLFYVSAKLQSFIKKGAGRGGKMITVDGWELAYTDLRPEFFMYQPKLTFHTTDTHETRSIRLEEVHKITIDTSLSEFAVRNGFYAGMGISLLRFVVKFQSLGQLFDVARVAGNVSTVYPGALTLTPLVTVGWMVYDFLRGDRELVINRLTPS
ncbi:MAG: hypothetical protein ACE5GH_04105, partial [Fidelibacterota bacterium]